MHQPEGAGNDEGSFQQELANEAATATAQYFAGYQWPCCVA